VFGFRQVGLDGDSGAAGGGDFVERLVKRSVVLVIELGVTGGESDRCAFAGQSLRDRLTQSAAGAGHQGDLAVAASCHRPTHLLVERRTASPIVRISFADGSEY